MLTQVSGSGEFLYFHFKFKIRRQARANTVSGQKKA